jgi:hypothetical protein
MRDATQLFAGKGMRLKTSETSRRAHALERPKVGRNHPHKKKRD